MPSRQNPWQAILYLTIGWFGIQMAMALDATVFQALLDRQLQDASKIGLVLGLGPLAGITVQPLMGWLGDKLQRRGIRRSRVMAGALIAALIATLLFAWAMPLGAMIAAIAFFFISFNVLAVNYRAYVTETANRKAVLSHKGTVSGFVAGFSGLGGFAMFALCSLSGDRFWIPAVASALVLAVTFLLVKQCAPQPKGMVQPLPETGDAAQEHGLWRGWNLAFYVMPFLSLLPAFERRLVQLPAQKAIFRLFLTLFFSWVGIQALRGYFVLFAVKSLGLSYAQANIPLAVLTLVMVLAALPLGRLADHMENRRLLRACLAMYGAVCLAGYFWVGSFPSVLALSVLIGLSFAGMIVLPLALLFKLCPPRSEGTYGGLYNLFMSIPQLYGLAITGALIDFFGDYRVILPVGAAAVSMAVLMTWRMAPEETAS